MAKGGKTNAEMKKLGRNLTKVANQKRSTRPVSNGKTKVNKNG